MKPKITPGQINTASWEMQDAKIETGIEPEDFGYHFYKVANALGYDSTPFVEMLEAKFPKECEEVIMMIKVTEGW